MGACVEAEPQLVFSAWQLIMSEGLAQHQQKLTGHASAFSARNRVRVCRFDHPPKNRGRREGRVPTAPMVRVQQKARGRTTGTGGSSGLPCAMVLQLIRALPGDRALLPPSSLRSLLLKNLAPASGRQDHTISPSASAAFVNAQPKRPPHPAPNVRDDRDTPLFSEAGHAKDAADLGFRAIPPTCGTMARRAIYA
jgi:hypothetical protein